MFTINVRANAVSDDDKSEFEASRLTLTASPEASAAADPMQAAEARMRRALGLEGERMRMERVEPAPRPAERFTPGLHKRRFVQDGDVPVTVVHGVLSGRREHPHSEAAAPRPASQVPTNRLEIAEQALAAETTARERAERALAETQAQLRDLRTKLGHAQLAQQEATEVLRREREAATELRTALQEAETRADNAQAAQLAAEQALAALRERAAAGDDALLPPPPPKRRGRPPRAVVASGLGVVAPDLGEDSPIQPVRRRGRPPRAALVPVAGEDAPIQPVRRRGRPPRAAVPIAAEADHVDATPVPAARRGRPPKSAEGTPRESKLIRWWLTPKSKVAKKR